MILKPLVLSKVLTFFLKNWIFLTRCTKDSKLAPALQKAAAQLENAKRQDAIKEKLSDRVTKQELLDRGILKGTFILTLPSTETFSDHDCKDGQIANSLQPIANNLEKALVTGNLKKSFEKIAWTTHGKTNA